MYGNQTLSLTELSPGTGKCIEATACLGGVGTLFLCLAPWCGVPFKAAFLAVAGATSTPSIALGGAKLASYVSQSCTQNSSICPSYNSCCGDKNENRLLMRNNNNNGYNTAGINNGNLGSDEDITVTDTDVSQNNNSNCCFKIC